LFVHLHNHSDYSLLDGACRIPQLIEIAASQGARSVGLTDHGNVFGALEFYTAARDAGLNPVLGCELYLAPGSRLDRSPGRAGEMRFHQVLFAKNLAGWRSLSRLSSEGHLSGFYYKPRIDRELLRECAEGLICLSSCMQGEIPQRILNNDPDGALEAARFYKEVFGDDFYIELQRHHLPEDERLVAALAQLAEDLDLRMVVTNDAHYLKREYAAAHDVLLCVGTQSKVTDANRLRFDTQEFYLKTPDEMAALFPDFPDALDITEEIAGKCSLEIPLGGRHFPIFQRVAANGNGHLSSEADLPTAEDELDRVAREGFIIRYGVNPSPNAVERLEMELGVIKQTGFANYFLIVWDFVRWARERSIPVGPGRGSAAGCIVSYCLGITNLDPLRWGLIFERFLNPERVSPPDIDIDFADDRREEVIKYVRGRYGEDAVCRIITFGKMAARSAVRDTARAMGLTAAEGDRLAKLIPESRDFTLEQALTHVPEIADLCAGDSRYRAVIEHATILEGAVRHPSVHAAGVVICPGPVTNYMPVYKNGTDPDLMSQFDMNWVDKLGLLKMDFLGLQTLQEIEITLRGLRAGNVDIDLDSLPFDDPKVFALFSEGRTTGVFQFESSGMRDNLMKLKPERLEDLLAMNALFRPGPMQFIDEFIARRHGRRKASYLHPRLEPILRETYGIIVYQEQVIRIATDLAGYSLGKADTFRKAMGKKKPELMAKEATAFIDGCVSSGIDRKVASEIFAACEQFAGYGFVKAHAAGYAVIAYHCAYLKVHHPVEYLAACLTVRRNDPSQVLRLMGECKILSIPIHRPDVNESEDSFKAEGDAIRFGLAAIRNVGEAAVATLLEARKGCGRFTSLHQFLAATGMGAMNRRMVESLIDAGAFDAFGQTRATLQASLPGAMAYAQAVADEHLRGQNGLFGGSSEAGTSYIQEPDLHILEEYPPDLLQSNEKKVLGYYITGHPLERYTPLLGTLIKHRLGDKEDWEDGRQVRIAGVVAAISKRTAKSGDRWMMVTLEDLTGTADCLLFSGQMAQFETLAVPDRLVAVSGRVTRREGREETNIRIEEMIPLEEVAERWGQTIKLRLNSQQVSEALLTRLGRLCTDSPGSSSLLIDLALPSGQRKSYRVGKFRVRPSPDLMRTLGEWVGPDCVSLMR